jgi:DNA-binding CsgD family transcriptional regulator
VASGGSYVESREFLLNGLCELIGADAWAWALSRVDPETHQIYFINYQNQGISDEQMAHIAAAVEHPTMVEAAQGFGQALTVTQKPITMHRQQIDPENVIYRGEIAEHWKQSGFKGLIMSGHPLDEHSFSHIVIYRDESKTEFDQRETIMAHIVLSEVSWLHAQGWPEDRGAKVPQLTPRQRNVLLLLTEGQTRKEIAHAMSISENTVASYVKDIYRHFEVHSQTELVKKFTGVIS